jgi:hypothetical protein
MGEQVKQVIQVFSSVMSGCPLCEGERHSNDAESYDDGYLEARVNHLLAERGCVVLHVGQQSDTDSDGNPWQMTDGRHRSAELMAAYEFVASIEAWRRASAASR